MSDPDSMPVPSTSDAPSPQLPAVIREHSTAKRRGQDVLNVRRGTSRRLRHGIYAVSEPSIRSEIVDECALIFARCPWLDEVRDGLAVEATGRLVTRLRKLDAVIEAGEAGQTLTSMYTRLEGQLTRNLAALGMGPAAAASLGLQRLEATERARRSLEEMQREYGPPKPKAKP